MKTILNSKNTLFILLLIYVFTPITAVLASGYFPDESLSKSVSVPKSGKIKFREDWVYRYNGKTVPIGIKKGYEHFDNFGLKLEEASYDINGKAQVEITYTYDEFGRESQCLGWKENKSFFSKWVYTFDEKTKTLEKSAFNTSANQEKTIYHFDVHGNIDEEISYAKDGELNYHYRISYTEFSKPAELVEYGANGEVYEKWTYLYNAQNQNIEVAQYDSNQELYKKFVNILNENGIQKEVLTFDKDGNKLEKIVSIYQFY